MISASLFPFVVIVGFVDSWYIHPTATAPPSDVPIILFILFQYSPFIWLFQETFAVPFDSDENRAIPSSPFAVASSFIALSAVFSSSFCSFIP